MANSSSHREREMIEVVGNFEVHLDKLLGKGGFAEVYFGKEKGTGRAVAAKKVLMKDNNNSMLEAEAEVSALRRVDRHENIVELLHSRPGLDCLWVFTEYCKEGSLDEYFITHELLLRHKVTIIAQSLAAVTFLHGQKPLAVAHRDIKPGNILIKHEKDQIVVKLADFGLSKICISYGGMAWAMKTYCGTEAFMAPEHFALQVSGAGRYDISVDVFALGLVILSMLTTKPGYILEALAVHGKPLGTVLFHMKRDGAEMWSPVRFNIAESKQVRELKVLVSMMLSYEPSERPAAHQLHAEVDAILDTIPPVNALPKSIKPKFSMDDFGENILSQFNHPNSPTVVESPKFRDPPAMEFTPIVGKRLPNPPNQKDTPLRGPAKPPRQRSPPRHRSPPLAEGDATAAAVPEDQGLRRAGHRTQHKRLSMGPTAGKLDLRQSIKFDRGPPTPKPKEPRFVVVGGIAGASISSIVWILNAVSDGFMWQNLTDLPDDMKQHNYSVCKTADDEFVVLGGGMGPSISKRSYKYSVTDDKWTRLPDMRHAHSGATAVCARNHVFVLGGADKREKVLAECEALNMDTLQWEPRQPMQQPMLLPIAAATPDGDDIYVVFNTHQQNHLRGGGGGRGSAASGESAPLPVQKLSLTTRKWTWRSPLPASVRDTLGAGLVAAGETGALYLVGGWDRLCVCYRPGTDTWTTLKPCDQVHVYHAPAYYQGRITMFGGADANGASKDIEEYDVERNTWRLRTLELPEPLQSHSAMVLML